MTVRMSLKRTVKNAGEHVSEKTVKEDSENAVGKNSEKDGGNVSERTAKKGQWKCR